MTDEDKEYLIAVITSTINKWSDFTDFDSGGRLAVRIANNIESEFALVTYQGIDKYRSE